MRVVIIGADGQLGSDATQAFRDHGDHVFALSHRDAEISEFDSVAGALRGLQPNLIVNTAAMHHVERCEQDAKAAFAVNALGPRNLAVIAEQLGSTLMHISTDYVFDGARNSPYEEGDTPRPLNTYGNTKLAGEHFVRCTAARHFVLRTSALYGSHPCRGKGGLNFVELMLKLGKERGKVRVVDSERVTPTFTYELAQQMVLLSRTENFGLFHTTAEGACTWYDFAMEIFAIANLPVKVEIAHPDEFPSKVKRPSYSVLENAGLKARRLNCFRPWQEGLRDYLELQRPSAANAAPQSSTSQS